MDSLLNRYVLRIFPTPPSGWLVIFTSSHRDPLQAADLMTVDRDCLTHRHQYPLIVQSRLLEQVLQEVALLEATQNGGRKIRFDLDPAVTSNIREESTFC